MSRDTLLAMRVLRTGVPGAPYVENNCYTCAHRRRVAGSAHISCANPDEDMVGNQSGIDGGWFMYPLNYDPAWMAAKCRNFQAIPAPQGTP